MFLSRGLARAGWTACSNAFSKILLVVLAIKGGFQINLMEISERFTYHCRPSPLLRQLCQEHGLLGCILSEPQL